MWIVVYEKNAQNNTKRQGYTGVGAQKSKGKKNAMQEMQSRLLKFIREEVLILSLIGKIIKQKLKERWRNNSLGML